MWRIFTQDIDHRFEQCARFFNVVSLFERSQGQIALLDSPLPREDLYRFALQGEAVASGLRARAFRWTVPGVGQSV